MIRVHLLKGLLAERKRGRATNQHIIDTFSLSAGEQAELLTLWNRVNGNQLTPGEVEEVLLIMQARAVPHETVAKAKTALGV